MVQQHEKKYIPYLFQFELSHRQSYFQMLQRNRFQRQGLSYFNCETESNTNNIMNEIKKNHHQEGKNLSNLHQIIDVKLNHKDHQLAEKIHIALRFGKHIFKIQYKKRPTMRFKKKLVIRDCKCCGLKMKRHKCTHTLCSINCTILKQYRNRIKKQSEKKQIFEETVQEVVSKVVKNMLQKIDKIINNIIDEQDQDKSSQMILEEDESQNENHQSQYVKNSSQNDEFEQQECAQKNSISLNQQKLSLEEGKEEQEEQKKQKKYEEVEKEEKIEKVEEQQEEAENYENLN